jgi:hypothetical protein
MRATFYMLPVRWGLHASGQCSSPAQPPEKLQIFETSNGKAIFTDLFSLEVRVPPHRLTHAKLTLGSTGRATASHPLLATSSTPVQ